MDNEGKIYAWGEGRSALPMRIITSEKIVQVSGNFILGANGLVYNISSPNTAISGLNEIAKISCGTNHNLALNVNGNVYAWGTNSYGECGTDVTGSVPVTYVGTNVVDISAGNGTSILESNTGSAYVIRK